MVAMHGTDANGGMMSGELAAAIRAAGRIALFTGAGIST
jgi:hypothetical protein